MKNTKELTRIKALGFRAGTAYQRWHALTPDGAVGPITTRSLNAPRICGLPDRLPARRKLCRWPKEVTVSWNVLSEFPKISRTDALEAAQSAFDMWAAVSGFRHRYKSGTRSVNIQITVIRGKPGGVLADSQLPCGRVSERTTLLQRYHSGEPWSLMLADQAPRHEISLPTVMAHEIGHAIGLDHIPESRAKALLNPTYNPQTPVPQLADMEDAQLRYGADALPPTPTPAPPPNGRIVHGHVRAWVDGTIFSLKGPMTPE